MNPSPGTRLSGPLNVLQENGIRPQQACFVPSGSVSRSGGTIPAATCLLNDEFIRKIHSPPTAPSDFPQDCSGLSVPDCPGGSLCARICPDRSA